MSEQQQIEITVEQKIIINRLEAKQLLAEAEFLEAQLQKDSFIAEMNASTIVDQDGETIQAE